MFGTHDLPLFIATGLLLNVTPGADSLYIVSRSITQGTRAGVAAALGIGLGCYVHILATALGLSAALLASATAFTFVKLIGAAYLVYLGISLLHARPSPTDALPTIAIAPGRSILVQGFLTNVLNPKVALFFLAFVPQFISPDASNKALSFVFLGAIFNFTGTLWCLFLAWSAGRFRIPGAEKGTAMHLNRGAGAIFVLLGLRLAYSEQN